MRKETRPIGRPPLPDEYRKSRIVPIRFKHSAYKEYSEIAASKGQTLSRWIRVSLEKEARRK